MYFKYSDYLKKKYGKKIYKLPVSIDCTCPNRNGRISYGGCSFCADVGAGFEIMPSTVSVKEQLFKNRDYIAKRYGAKGFIAYFQNYTNTFVKPELFKKYMTEAAECDIENITVSTRPDCLITENMNILEQIRNEKGIDITIELGLQTANYKTLQRINRGHTLAEYINGCMEVKRYGFELCTHMILNLPYDGIDDVIEGAKLVSVMKNDHVKLHSLYIAKGSEMARQYQNGEFEICSCGEYIERAVSFLEYLSPDISIERLIGRVPEKDSLFANWGRSWWVIKEEIENKMKNENRFQGSKFNYMQPITL